MSDETTKRKPRFQVHDEEGPLRAFYSKQEALDFMLPGMKLVILPGPKRKPNPRKLAWVDWEPALM